MLPHFLGISFHTRKLSLLRQYSWVRAILITAPLKTWLSAPFAECWSVWIVFGVHFLHSRWGLWNVNFVRCVIRDAADPLSADCTAHSDKADVPLGRRFRGRPQTCDCHMSCPWVASSTVLQQISGKWLLICSTVYLLRAISVFNRRWKLRPVFLFFFLLRVCVVSYLKAGDVRFCTIVSGVRFAETVLLRGKLSVQVFVLFYNSCVFIVCLIHVYACPNWQYVERQLHVSRIDIVARPHWRLVNGRKPCVHVLTALTSPWCNLTHPSHTPQQKKTRVDTRDNIGCDVAERVRRALLNLVRWACGWTTLASTKFVDFERLAAHTTFHRMHK